MRRAALTTLAVLVLLVASLGGYLTMSPEAVLHVAIAVERGAGNLEEKTLESMGHQIVYLDGGVQGGETVLLIHGFAADKDNWTRFSRHLKKAGYHVVFPDLPGHGQSSQIESFTYDIPNHVAFIDDFLDQLGLEKVHIAGNSMGGHIAAAYTATHPDRVLSVGLFNAGGVTSPVPSARVLLEQETGQNSLLVENVEDFDRLLDFLFVEPPMMPRAIKEHFAAQAVLHRDQNDKMFKDLTGGGRSMPLEPLLPSIQVPTLVLWGDSDQVLDVSSVGVFEAGLSHSTTVIMKDCGHSPMIERPGETAEHYLAFLAASQE